MCFFAQEKIRDIYIPNACNHQPPVMLVRSNNMDKTDKNAEAGAAPSLTPPSAETLEDIVEASGNHPPGGMVNDIEQEDEESGEKKDPDNMEPEELKEESKAELHRLAGGIVEEAVGSSQDDRDKETISKDAISASVEDGDKTSKDKTTDDAEIKSGNDENDDKGQARISGTGGESKPGAFAVANSGETGESTNHCLEQDFAPFAGSQLLDSQQLNEELINEPERTRECPEEDADCLPSMDQDDGSRSACRASPNNNSNDVNGRLFLGEADQIPMVTADLVTPPVEAYQVDFDEIVPELASRNASNGAVGNRNFQHLEISNNDDDETIFKQRKKRRQWLQLGILALFAIALSVVVAVVVVMRNNDDDPSNIHGNAQGPTTAPTPPYDCFTSTADLVRAQINHPEQLTFVMCPNIRIKLAVMANPAANDFRLVNGDSPLMAVRENVEIRCGLDGSVDNNCVFEGGFLQVLLQPSLPDVEIELDARTDNVTIRGMTFTGKIEADAIFSGVSIVMSNPGELTMVDCLWENMTSTKGLMLVGTNAWQLLNNKPALGLHSASLTIANSTFRNMVYDGSMFAADGQILRMSGLRFEDITLSAYLTACMGLPGERPTWCQVMVYV